MRPTNILYLTLTVASTLAAPTRRANSISQRQDSPNLPADSMVDTSPAANLGDVVLPPVFEVFEIMAAHGTPSTSTSPSSATPANDIRLGPGLVLAPTATVEHVDASPSAVASSPTSTTSPHIPSPMAHRFVFVSVVILSMIAVILTIYAISYHRHQLRTNNFNSGQTRVLPASESLVEEKLRKSGCSVVDISRNYPRSKFSVTSSDYAISTRSSTISESDGSTSSKSESDSGSEKEYSERRLMDPAHFFALSSSSMASSRRHSRGGSAPVFGVPRFDGRRCQSRRSRSVSGAKDQW